MKRFIFLIFVLCSCSSVRSFERSIDVQQDTMYKDFVHEGLNMNIPVHEPVVDTLTFKMGKTTVRLVPQKQNPVQDTTSNSKVTATENHSFFNPFDISIDITPDTHTVAITNQLLTIHEQSKIVKKNLTDRLLLIGFMVSLLLILIVFIKVLKYKYNERFN